MNNFFSASDTENLIRSTDWIYETAGTTWSDGLLLGNGNLGAVSYAPNSAEWLINKLDVFDGRVRKCAGMLPHHKVMKHMDKHGLKDSFFLDELDKVEEPFSITSVTPLILKLHLGNGELGWCAQAFPNISQRLCLYEGELYMNMDAHFMHTRCKALTPRGTDVFALRVEGCSIYDWTHTVEVYRPYHDDMKSPRWQSDNDGIYFEQTCPDGVTHYAVAIRIVPRHTDISRVSYSMPPEFDFASQQSGITGIKTGNLSGSIGCSGDFDVFVAVCSSYEYSDPLASAREQAAYAVNTGFEALETHNRSWWESFWSKSAADFGGQTDIQRYFNFSVYELGCSFEKAPMPALNGLCCGPVSPTSPGVNSPFYTHDQNAQMPSMPLIMLNHTELTDALTDTYINVLPELKEHTAELFCKTGGEGIFLPLTLTQKGIENPSGSYRYTWCGSAYTGLVLSLVWKYTHDTDKVRDKIYPLLCELIRFYTTNIINLGEDGKYHMDRSVPPEIFTMTRDDAATLSMLKTCINTVAEISDALGDKSDEITHWKHIADNLPRPAINKSGAWWPGPEVPDEHFCFGGHLLYPFFPSEAYVTPDDKEVTKKTLEYIQTHAIERSFANTDGKFHYLHDWSWLLTSMARQRVEQKNRFPELTEGLGYFAKPNGLFSHDAILITDPALTEANYEYSRRSEGYSADPGRSLWWYSLGRCATSNPNAKRIMSPVLEGNSIFLMCATETLLQSYDGVIRLFPGVPEDFTGKFRGFLAEGGFEVTAAMECGRVTALSITALSDSELKIYVSKGLESIRDAVLEELNGEKVMCKKLKKGEIFSM